MLGTSFSRETGGGAGGRGEGGGVKIDKYYDHKMFVNLHPPPLPSGKSMCSVYDHISCDCCAPARAGGVIEGKS